jgi:hypothetical protein
MFLCTERWKNVNYLYRVFSIKTDTTNHLHENAYLLFFLIILNFISMLQAGKLVDNQTQLFGLRNTTKFKTCSDINNIFSIERKLIKGTVSCDRF